MQKYCFFLIRTRKLHFFNKKKAFIWSFVNIFVPLQAIKCAHCTVFVMGNKKKVENKTKFI